MVDLSSSIPVPRPVSLPVYQVDAFTSQNFGGNPASVVILDDWLADETLQNIAAELNLSETAFVVGRHLRWFTPRMEVDLCGHATLASAFLLAKEFAVPDNPIVFDTRSGPLTVAWKEDDFTLNFPAWQTHETTIPLAQIEDALGVSVEEVLTATDRYVCIVGQSNIVAALRPNFLKLAQLPLPGLVVSAQTDGGFDFVSRYFAPAKGVPEDPVTGTSHCILAPLWGKRLNKKLLRARQLSPRGGDITCRLFEDRVELSGQARLFSRGRIYLDDARGPSDKRPGTGYDTRDLIR